MSSRFCWLIALLFVPLSLARSDEALDIAGTYRRIIGDYQRIAATRNAGAREAAARLTRDAYGLLIERTKNTKDFSADDLHALGACHEGLGQLDKAKELYLKSLDNSDLARTHLALVRVNLNSDLAASEKHFTEAVKLDPEYPAARLQHVHGSRRAHGVALDGDRVWARDLHDLHAHRAAGLVHHRRGRRLDTGSAGAAMEQRAPADAIRRASGGGSLNRPTVPEARPASGPPAVDR